MAITLFRECEWVSGPYHDLARWTGRKRIASAAHMKENPCQATRKTTPLKETIKVKTIRKRMYPTLTLAMWTCGVAARPEGIRRHLRPRIKTQCPRPHSLPGAGRLKRAHHQPSNSPQGCNMADNEISSQQESSQAVAASISASVAPVISPPPDLLIIKDVFDAELRNSLIREARSCEFKQATVNKDKQSILDTSTRNVRTIIVPKETRAMVADRLMRIKPRLEEHFATELVECQKPVFLLYTEGGFYVPHADASRLHNSVDSILSRKISVVIFLNSRSEAGGGEGYGGGELIFYGNEDDPDWDLHSFQVAADAGSLVAFRSEVVHSVEPVTTGERFTIVSWFV
jgi:SM-20-related protein